MKRNIKIFLIAMILCLPLFAGDFPVIKGWKPVSKVTSYVPSNLWEYINGAADLFISFGLREVNCCDLKSGDLVVTVNIYDMDSRLNAFGIYKTEVSPEIKKAGSVLNGVVMPPYQCIMIKDKYYIKVDAFEGKITNSIGEELLKAIAGSINGREGIPEEFSLLPEKGRVAESEGYLKDSFLGSSYLNNVIFARYKENKKEYTLFFLLSEDDNDIADLHIKFQDGWRTKKYKGRVFFFKEIPYQGVVGLAETKRGFIGASGFKREKDVMKGLKNLIINGEF